MLDNILGGLKDQVIGTITEKAGIDAGQAEQAIPMAKESIMSGVMGAVSGGNVSGILGMFSGGEGGMMQNMVYQGIASNFVGSLTSKLGLSSDIANMVSSSALPMIMNKIGGSAKGEDGNVSQEGLMGALGIEGGGMMDMLKDKAGDMLGGGGDSDSPVDAIKDKAEDLLKDGLGGLFGK